MLRVACFVDGFNLYHAIDRLRDENNNRFDHLKWIDLWGLASAFIPPSTQRLVSVHYFSAYAKWLAIPYARHQAYVAALKWRGVSTNMADFKEKERGCNRCGAEWIAHEEKESDVNFAVKFVHLAHTNAFDRALLVTADSDICPAIRLVLEHFPALKITVLTPPNGYNLARELRGTVETVRIRRRHLHQNLLPASIELPGGNRIVRPSKYTPPTGVR
jgi:hypothetical protein